MNEKETKGRAPDYSGDGIAVWVNKDKNGKTYLSVSKPEWSKNLALFKVEPKKEQKIVKEAGYNEQNIRDLL